MLLLNKLASKEIQFYSNKLSKLTPKLLFLLGNIV